MTQAYAHRDDDQFCKILHTGLALFHRPVAVFIIFVAVIVFFNPALAPIHQPATVRWYWSWPSCFPVCHFAAAKRFITVYFAVEMLPVGHADQSHAVMNLTFMAGVMAALGHGAIAILQLIPYGSLPAWPWWISTGNFLNSRSYPEVI